MEHQTKERAFYTIQKYNAQELNTTPNNLIFYIQRVDDTMAVKSM
jgi:hypothetical protein